MFFEVFNATYKNNLMTLKNFVMVKFLNDTMVQPKESEVTDVLFSNGLCLFSLNMLKETLGNGGKT